MENIMKKIGFIDYYISEWHANNYPVWMKEISDEFEVAYAWAEVDVSPVDGRTTDEWCRDFGVTRCASIEELCEKSDYIVILAPTNPECHLGYAEVALKYGKNTYIDKTFAPDYATAKKIFDIASEHGTKFFSSSALRYADELTEYAGRAESAVIYGGGSNAPEYIIHQVEMLVKLVGTGACDVNVEKTDDGYKASVTYCDDRRGELNFACDNKYKAIITISGETHELAADSPFFMNLMSDMLRFFKTGVTSFDTAETLEVMKIREKFVNQI